MKIIITGSNSMLAQDLIPLLKKDHEVKSFSRQELDITKKDIAAKIIKSNEPEVVINCAAFTNVDKAEKERDKAFLVNGTGVQNLALLCADAGIPLCHISTDYVFDGKKKKPYTPFDNPSPINAYGESKLAGEKYVQWILNKFYIVRTSWLYGRGGSNFVSMILKMAKERSEIRVVKDQINSPTSAMTLANGIKHLIKSGAYGIYHITDSTEGGISRFDFAKKAVLLAGLKTKIIPVSSNEFPAPAKRPAYSVLDTTMTELVLKISLPDWGSGLKQFIKANNKKQRC
ncbi:MAG: dTDP-4-dehydrorhamnose reductase [Nitrospirae bacterium]|nr:dTDP-4-dehydrorhamnose reductase [Nitrospirota bacterium]